MLHGGDLAILPLVGVVISFLAQCFLVPLTRQQILDKLSGTFPKVGGGSLMSCGKKRENLIKLNFYRQTAGQKSIPFYPAVLILQLKMIILHKPRKVNIFCKMKIWKRNKKVYRKKVYFFIFDRYGDVQGSQSAWKWYTEI